MVVISAGAASFAAISTALFANFWISMNFNALGGGYEELDPDYYTGGASQAYFTNEDLGDCRPHLDTGNTLKPNQTSAKHFRDFGPVKKVENDDFKWPKVAWLMSFPNR